MLSDEDIKKAIQQGKIEVAVSFGKKDGKIVLFEQEKELLYSELAENLYSDRLKLTLGPIIKLIKRRYIPSKYRFKNYKDLFDMRKSDNQYFIEPGESVIVLTNERMRLNGDYSCLVVPRISLTDVGIVATTAYVDPYYNGVMRLQISNMSDKIYELRTLEAIAQCFFFKMSSTTNPEFKNKFPQKSVFFGQTWKEILESDRTPFPTKKKASETGRDSVKQQMYAVKEFIKTHSIILAIFTNFFVAVGSLSLIWQQFNSMNSSVNRMEEMFTSKASEIIIDVGETYGEKEINVNIPKSDIISVLCDNENIGYQIMSGLTPDETRIVFSYEILEPIDEPYMVSFNYTIVGSIKQ